MPEPHQETTLNIRWVRSGTGFTRFQKEIVRSLGLRRLNQIVSRPDTPGTRGLVAKVSHLVEVVNDARAAGSNRMPEYSIVPVETAANKPAVEAAAEEPATGGSESSTG